mgnify:CR=1 FL=1
MPDKKYILSDIKVETVGLVDKGAVQEEFLLVKRGGKEMADEITSQSLLERLEALFKQYFGQKEEVKPEVQPVEKEEINPDPVEELSKKVAASEEQITTLKTELVKAQEDVAKAAEEHGRLEWVEKAEVCKSLPIKKDELGGNLAKLAKVDKDVAEWFYAVLKAADKMLSDAGVFAEVGTSEGGPTTLVEKIEAIRKADPTKSFADALSGLSKDEQNEYLADSRKRGGKE